MATTTTNYGLTKPDSTEYYDIEVFNVNSDIIDEALGNITTALESLGVEVSSDTSIVTSFNGRTGDVEPATGDYTASQIMYDSSTTVYTKIYTLNTSVSSLSTTLNTYSALLSTLSEEAEDYISVQDNAGSHNAIYGGRSLGTITSTQLDAIEAGTFDDMYIGDYWTISGTKYRIAAFDYFYNCAAITTHHVVVVPDNTMYTAKMSSVTNTAGGYASTTMYKSGLSTANSTVKTAFGSSHVLTHLDFITAAIGYSGSSYGYPSAGSWEGVTCNLMDERMIWGNTMWGASINNTFIGESNFTPLTSARGQFPLFRFAPEYIMAQNSVTYWLREICSRYTWCTVYSNGVASWSTPTASLGVRPYFLVY